MSTTEEQEILEVQQSRAVKSIRTSLTKLGGSQELYSNLADIVELHNRKAADYALPDEPYWNFFYAAAYAGVSVDIVFKVMLGVKHGRLRALEMKGVQPLNESVADTQTDFMVYSLLHRSMQQAYEEGILQSVYSMRELLDNQLVSQL